MDGATMGSEVTTEETHPFGEGSEENTPIGIDKGTLVAGGGIYDETTDALHNAIGSVVGVSRIVCAAIFGNVAGLPFMGFAGPYSQKYDVMDARDALTKANVTYLVSGAVDEGVIVQQLTQYSADWDTKTGGAGAPDAPVDLADDTANRPVEITSNSVANPTVVTCTTPHGLTTGDKVLISGVTGSTPTINGEYTATVTGTNTFTVPVNVTIGGTGGSFVRTSTNAGGVGYLQCSQYAGFTNVVVRITDSPDDITYSTLITFSTITAAPAKERITVSGTVDRYLASTGTVSGSGTITVFTGFKRY